jgi:hypothetical protein
LILETVISRGSLYKGVDDRETELPILSHVSSDNFITLYVSTPMTITLSIIFSLCYLLGSSVLVSDQGEVLFDHSAMCTIYTYSPSFGTAQWELALAASVGMMNYGQQQVYPAMRCEEDVGLWGSTCMPRGVIDIKIDAAIVA